MTMTANAQFGPLERFVMPGPLIEGHAEYESECRSCHVQFDRGSQRRLCLDCHKEIADDLATQTGYHSLSPDVGQRECAECHADHEGRGADIVGLVEDSFDHGLTDFPLRDSHLEVGCADCHMPDLTFHSTETECVSCHLEDDQHMGNLGAECADCHIETEWSDAHFDHELKTGYMLTGAHDDISCVSCHVEELYEGTSDECVSCHRDDDSHMGTNGTECQDCHTSLNWEDVLFDHGSVTGFALVDGHGGLECESCHEGNKYEQELSTECFDCHEEDDSHDGINGSLCGDCHQATEWLDVTFDHERDAEFALHDAHADLACNDCHFDPVAVALPATDCFGCHDDDDPHEGQLGQECDSCHSEASFTPTIRFDHDLTRFPLLGRHAEVECDDCHETHAFLDAEDTCVSCHREDDIHERRLGDDCATCHTPNDWLLWVFDHDSQTDFPLTGSHTGLDCHACHREPAVDGVVAVSTECGGCHRSDDPHFGEFGQDCQECHTTESFGILRSLR